MQAAGFERLHITKRYELWQNRNVTVDFSDDTLESYWSESLEKALAQKDSIPIKF
jgi:hypothetical protein